MAQKFRYLEAELAYSWNSAVFTTLQANEFRILVVSPDFLSSSSFDCNLANLKYNDATPPNSTEFCIIAEALYDSSTGLERLENAKCMQAYSSTFVSGRQNLLAVVRDTGSTTLGQNPANGSILYYLDSTLWDYNLMNDGGWMPDLWPCSSPECANDWQIGPLNAKIDYCLSQVVPALCQLQFISYIMIAVIGCNIAKLVAIIFTVRASRELPLAVVGDAVSSFMMQADQSTVGMCLYTARSLNAGLLHQVYKARGVNTSLLSQVRYPRRWATEKVRWYSTSTKGSWFRLFAL
jgi:hypothetical protein